HLPSVPARGGGHARASNTFSNPPAPREEPDGPAHPGARGATPGARRGERAPPDGSGRAPARVRPGPGGGDPGPGAGALLARLEPACPGGARPGPAGCPQPGHRASGGLRARLGPRLRLRPPGCQTDTALSRERSLAISPRRELPREAHRPGGDGEPRARVLLAGRPASRPGDPLPRPPEPPAHRDT